MRIRFRPSHATVVAYLALFVALGGTTYAATGGNFILGQSNSASSTTSLTRTGANAAKGLQVTNTGTGAGATALGLSVASGHAPFTVNSGTKVANLNADKLDGLDSTGFIRGQKLDVVLPRPSSGNGTLTKIATVGPYDINGRCDEASGNTLVRISAKGAAGISEAVYSRVANDSSDLGNFSGATALPANVDTQFASALAVGGDYVRAGGTAVLRSDSGSMVQVNFTALAFDAAAEECHVFGTAMMGS
jgi:hypothetical protein